MEGRRNKKGVWTFNGKDIENYEQDIQRFYGRRTGEIQQGNITENIKNVKKGIGEISKRTQGSKTNDIRTYSNVQRPDNKINHIEDRERLRKLKYKIVCYKKPLHLQG